jgi:hypothetical protein
MNADLRAGFYLFDSAGQVFVVRTLLRTAESMAAPLFGEGVRWPAYPHLRPWIEVPRR